MPVHKARAADQSPDPSPALLPSPDPPRLGPPQGVSTAPPTTSTAPCGPRPAGVSREPVWAARWFRWLSPAPRSRPPNQAVFQWPTNTGEPGEQMNGWTGERVIWVNRWTGDLGKTLSRSPPVIWHLQKPVPFSGSPVRDQSSINQ